MNRGLKCMDLKKETYSVDARELLHDLQHGGNQKRALEVSGREQLLPSEGLFGSGGGDRFLLLLRVHLFHLGRDVVRHAIECQCC